MDFGQVGPRVQGNGGQCEDGGDPQSHAIRGGFSIDPEADPREDDDEDAGDVDLDEEVA